MNNKKEAFEELEDATSNCTDISWYDWEKKVIVYDIIYLTEIMKHLIDNSRHLGADFPQDRAGEDPGYEVETQTQLVQSNQAPASIMMLSQ